MQFPKGVHRVSRKLANGQIRWHFYAWRKGPKFWVDNCRIPRDPDFFHAFADFAAKPRQTDLMVPQLVDDFLSSTALPKGERSRADLRKWALRFAEYFREAPAKIFEEQGARAEMDVFRALWKHSP